MVRRMRQPTPTIEKMAAAWSMTMPNTEREPDTIAIVMSTARAMAVRNGKIMPPLIVVVVSASGPVLVFAIKIEMGDTSYSP